VLQWTRDYGLASKIAAEVAHEYLAIVRGDDDDESESGGGSGGADENDENDDASSSNSNKKTQLFFSSPRPGVARWISALRSARVPSTVVTSLDRKTLLAALERMDLLSDDLLPLSSASSFVTAEDGAESLAHSLLAGALKLGRPPNACCAFVASPAGVAAAHNASMRAVAVAGEHASHELRSADATVSRLDELAVIQVRRLFNSGSPEGTPGAFMGKQKERAPGAGGGKKEEKRRGERVLERESERERERARERERERERELKKTHSRILFPSFFLSNKQQHQTGTGGDGSWFDPDADAAARRQSRRRRVAGGVIDPPPPANPEAAPGGSGGGRRGDDDGGDWRRRR
jgi:beta-phosphoglucomutase-like phosphatase (HAD superfamily)